LHHNTAYRFLNRLIAMVLGGLVCGHALAQSSNPSPGLAQAFLPAPGQRFYLDLDSQAGAFSQWLHDDVRALNSLRAVLRVPRLGNDARWLPGFTISLASNETKDVANDLGLQVVAVNRKPPMTMRLVGHLAGNRTQEIPLTTTLKLNEDLTVEMRWAHRT
jgi:hypothetical protein